MTTIEEYFDKSVLSLYGKSRGHKGDVGLEIECEGDQPHPDSGESLGMWKTVPEGSLRNGVEYVLRTPQPIARIPEVMEYWKDLTKKCRFERSIRTSVHVHINVQALNYNEVLRFLGLYWLVEDILVTLNGRLRVGNLFCLRIRDADELVYDIFNVTSDARVMDFHPDHARYAALNLVALSKFGSLEFRFVKGMTTPRPIQYWAENLYELVHQSRGIKDLQTFLDGVQFNNILPTLEAILPPALYKSAVMRFTVEELSQMVRSNYDLSLKLSNILKRPVPVKVLSLHKKPLEDIENVTEFPIQNHSVFM